VQTRVRPGSSDAGETLIELIIAVAIMGITVVALVGGIATTILMSDIHRKQATAGAYVRDYAEAVAGHYDAKATPDYLPAAVDFSVPTGFTAEPVGSVRCWNNTGLPAPKDRAFGDCAQTDAVQQVTLRVTSADSRASESLVVVVRKPW
jgi:type II secretory pathway pseudopilin PulG